MKQEKFNIKLERKILRLKKNYKVSNGNYPKAFGNEEENDFIKEDSKNNSILNIKTPNSTSVVDAYNKLQEITNVVTTELYSLDEIIWPFEKYEKIDLYNKIHLQIDNEFYQEIQKLNKNLPESLDDAIINLKNQFESRAALIEKVFGKITLTVRQNKLEISHVKLNYKNRYGITLDQVYFLIAFIFDALEIREVNTLQELIKGLTTVSKIYQLKSKDSVKLIESEIKSKEKETTLSLDEQKKIAEDYMEDGYNTRYCLQKYQKLVAESVVIIKDAIAKGIDYKVLNEVKSVVEFKKKGHKEFVIEGNKTDRDNYIFPIITDDKFTSKQIMKNAGINVPNAILLEKDMDAEDIENLVSPYYNKKLVVKPRNTNYGTGITVFSENATKKQIMNAIEYAFTFDNNILIEEYVKGMEYRFLVVNGKCLSVAHRRIASVVGDGKSTIEELIDAKNKEPWHYLTGCPVKKDQPVVEYLKLQGLDYSSVIPEGKRIFLRTNSNCSTGGESVDYTPVMPERFKKIAEKAAKAFDAKICGVDIIINDRDKDDYAIIEINDNPGYSINEWPYEGKGEKIGLNILKLLSLV